VIPVLVGFLGTASRALRKFMWSALGLATLLIELSGELIVIRCAALVAARLCLMTAVSGGICTYIAGHVFKSARTPKTAAAFARSLEGWEQISVRWLVDCCWVGVVKSIQQECMAGWQYLSVKS
jgi:membrane protein YqaA with SNARE-associated domain